MRASPGNSAGEPASTVPPKSASRALILETVRLVLIASLSFSMISVGVFVSTLIAAGVQAVIVTRDALFFNERRRVAELAATFRLPTGHGEKLEFQAGGLVSYGVDVPANYGRAAYFVDKVLKGATPADLPLEFPTKLEMAINSRPQRYSASTYHH